MADSFSVSGRYQFSGNALEFMARLAELSELATRQLGELAKVSRTINREMLNGVRANEAFTASLDGVGRGLGAVTARADAAVASIRRVGAASRATSSAGGSGFGSFIGGVGKGAAIAGLLTEAIGIRGAATLQDQTIQTGLALGRSTSYVNQNLVPLAMQMSMKTAQSVTDSMGLLRTMATSGLNDPTTMRALAMPIAQFADTQFLGKNKVPFNQSAAMLASLSHELNLRTADQLMPFANTLYKISNDMPDSLKTAATQIKYYGANYASRGVSPSEILVLQATADRLGFGGGKSGTGLNMILRNLENPTKAQFASQSALGLIGPDGKNRFLDPRTGAFSDQAFFSYLNSGYNAARKNGTVGDFNQRMDRAFSSNAGLIAGAFASNAGRQQYSNVEATLKRVPDLWKAQAILMGSLNHQTQLLTSNFQTLATLLASPLIAPLTSLVSSLANLVGGSATYLQEHPAVQNLAAGGLAAASVVAAYTAFKFMGGIGLFAHAAVRAGGERFGIGAIIGRIRGHGAAAAAEVGAARVESTGLIEIFKVLGVDALKSRYGLELLGTAIKSLGLRAIPVVGNLLLMSDAIKTFVSHSAQIDDVFAKAGAWINVVGKPMLMSAMSNAWSAAITAIGNGLASSPRFLWDSFKNSLTGGTSGGVQGATVYYAQQLHKIQNENDYITNLKYAKYAAQYGSRQGSGAFNPAAVGAGGVTVNINGDVHLPGVKNSSDLGKAFADFRHQNARAGSSGATPFSPAFLSSGLATGH
jgi:TP901 family phage tail tape measure protein